MQGVRNATGEREGPQVGGEVRSSDGDKEVLEVHWPEVKELDAPDGHREFRLAKCRLQQRTRRHNMQPGHLLMEVAKRRQRLGHGLNLVQEQHAFARGDGLTGHEAQRGDDACRVVACERFAEFGVELEVDGAHALRIL